MKRNFVLLVCSLFAITQLNAQVSGNYQYGTKKTLDEGERELPVVSQITDDESITLQVNGLMNIAADDYVVMFNIIQVGETVENTNELMNTRIASFTQKLKVTGIEPTEIKTDFISLVPKYDVVTENKVFSKTYNEVPGGFEMQKNITIHYKNSSKLDDIISAAASAEIYDVVKVDYFTTGIQKSLDSLRNVCLAKIKQKVKGYYQIGFTLDTLKKVMNDDFKTLYPQTRYYSYQAFARPSISNIKKKATYNEASKSISKFYNQLDYDNYDIVINPVVTEPVIQLSYSVTVKYFLRNEEPAKKAYYISTSSGELKQIQF